MENPRYLIKYFENSYRNGKRPEPSYRVADSDEEILEFVKNLMHNYWIYTIGGIYKSKEYFQEIIKSRQVDKEVEEFERLKKKLGK